jgi:hypothetical protein
MLLPEVFLEFLQGRHSPGLNVGQAPLDTFESLQTVVEGPAWNLHLI